MSKFVAASLVLVGFGFLTFAIAGPVSAQSSGSPAPFTAGSDFSVPSPMLGESARSERWDVYVQWKERGAWQFYSQEGSQKHAATVVFNLVHQNGAHDATYYYYRE
jgi:hypothetical protein